MAHARRELFKVYEKHRSPIAEEGLRRIGELYAIEAAINGSRPSSAGGAPGAAQAAARRAARLDALAAAAHGSPANRRSARRCSMR